MLPPHKRLQLQALSSKFYEYFLPKALKRCHLDRLAAKVMRSLEEWLNQVGIASTVHVMHAFDSIIVSIYLLTKQYRRNGRGIVAYSSD